MTLEYELVDANGGIQKVGVEPATRSAVATCMIIQKYLEISKMVNLEAYIIQHCVFHDLQDSYSCTQLHR